MGQAIVTLKIMPEAPDTNLEEIEKKAKVMIVDFVGEGDTKTEIEPIAFGLKALKIIFIMDEAQGSTESLENNITTIEGVNSVDVSDVRRAIG